jgi:hypothetical protein
MATLNETLDSLNFEALIAYYDLSSDKVKEFMDGEQFITHCCSKFSIDVPVKDFEQLISEYFFIQGDYM